VGDQVKNGRVPIGRRTRFAWIRAEESGVICASIERRPSARTAGGDQIRRLLGQNTSRWNLATRLHRRSSRCADERPASRRT